MQIRIKERDRSRTFNMISGVEAIPFGAFLIRQKILLGFLLECYRFGVFI
ncbi:hypothetical protein SAMN06298216_0341 [Spirosomataceae bacterium TFI 002]|nr:hypothetical protein SAMN06298216_0341 [Spirosomataceae bacterium TFI 002]